MPKGKEKTRNARVGGSTYGFSTKNGKKLLRFREMKREDNPPVKKALWGTKGTRQPASEKPDRNTEPNEADPSKGGEGDFPSDGMGRGGNHGHGRRRERKRDSDAGLKGPKTKKPNSVKGGKKEPREKKKGDLRKQQRGMKEKGKRGGSLPVWTKKGKVRPK